MKKRIFRGAAAPVGIALMAAASVSAAAPPQAPARAVAETKPATRGCSGFATALPGQDWQHGRATSSVAGHPGYWQFYEVRLTSGNSRAQAQVLGFDNGRPVWAPLPLLSTPDEVKFQIRVKWGNILGNPEIRIKVPPFHLSTATVEFSC